MSWYLLLILAVGAERLVELFVARRNMAWSLAHGGHEVGFAQYPFMVALHLGLFVGAVAEVWSGDRPFLPWLGWPMLAVVVAAQGLRWWCIRTLGPQWNTRIVVVPGATTHHWRALSMAGASQLRRGSRRRCCATARAHRVDHCGDIHCAQRRVAHGADPSRGGGAARARTGRCLMC